MQDVQPLSAVVNLCRTIDQVVKCTCIFEDLTMVCASLFVVLVSKSVKILAAMLRGSQPGVQSVSPKPLKIQVF